MCGAEAGDGEADDGMGVPEATIEFGVAST